MPTDTSTHSPTPRATSGSEVPGDMAPLLGLTAGLPARLLLLDEEGVICWASGGLGDHQPGDLVGQRLDDCVLPEVQGLVEAAVGDAFSPGIPHQIDVPIQDEGESPAWYRLSVGPTPGTGQAERLLAVAQEITDQQEELARLRRSKRLMVDTQDVAHLGTWEWDVSLPHAEWSEELYRIYGLDPATHTPTYQDYLTRVHPEDRERVKLATERAFKELQPYAHDERIVHTNGEVRYLHTWAEPVLDQEGNLVRLLGVCQDITERKHAELALERSEARLQAIFDEAAMGIATLGTQGTFRETNPALVELLGYSPQALAGLSLIDLVHMADRQEVQARIDELLSGRVASIRLEARLVDNHLEPVWTRLVLSMAHVDQDPGAFLVAMIEDISTQRQAQEALLEQAEELRRSNEELERFTYVTSHDLKEPLRMVASYVQLLQRRYQGALDEDADEYIGFAVEGTQRMNDLLNDLLAYSRVDAEEVPTEVVDLGEVVATVLSDLEGIVEANEASVTVDELPHVVGNRGQLVHLLENLVANALKFRAEGHAPRVHVEARRDGASWVVAVADHGIGIDPEYQDRIWTVFKRLHSREEYPGTGVGLAVCKRIAERHDGEIWVASRGAIDGVPETESPRDPATDGHRWETGSTFHVRLPAASGDGP